MSGRRTTPLAAGSALLVFFVLVAGPGRAIAQTPPPPTPDASPAPTALETPADPTRPPRLDAPAFLLLDAGGQVLHEREADAPRPVASLTKLMTAFLAARAVGEGQARWSESVTVSPAADARAGSTAELEAGERVRLRDLLAVMLVTSANDAAIAIGEHLEGSVEGFVDEMNRTAGVLGMRDTAFTSPDGFDDTGTSTARDLATCGSSSSTATCPPMPSRRSRRPWRRSPSVWTTTACSRTGTRCSGSTRGRPG